MNNKRLLLIMVLAAAVMSQTIRRQDTPQRNLFKGFGFFPSFRYSDFSTCPGVVKALLDDMKPAVLRFELGPGFSNGGGHVDPNDGDLKSLVQRLKLSRAKGVTKWIGVHWSPPVEFRKARTEDCMSGGTENSLVNEDGYAAYIAELVGFFRDQGAPLPWGISVQNEGSWCPEGWSGLKMEPEQMKRMVVKFRAALDKAGFGLNGTSPVRVQAPESGSLSGSTNLLGGTTFSHLSDSTYRSSVSDLLTHTYNPTSWSGGQYADAYRDGLNKYPQYDAWQTEISGLWANDDELLVTIAMSQEIGKWFVYLPGNYWLFWAGWRPDFRADRYPNEFLTWGNVTSEPPNRSKWYYTYQTIMNNAAIPGFVYKFTTTDQTLRNDGTEGVERWVDMYAFEGEGRSVVVLINGAASARSFVVQNLKGFGSSATVYRTSSSETMKNLGFRAIDAATGNLEGTVDLPSKSVVVMVTNGGKGPASSSAPGSIGARGIAPPRQLTIRGQRVYPGPHFTGEIVVYDTRGRTAARCAAGRSHARSLDLQSSGLHIVAIRDHAVSEGDLPRPSLGKDSAPPKL